MNSAIEESYEFPYQEVLADNVFHIVGDKFKSFADGNTILCHSAALENIEFLAKVGQGIFLGQGVSPAEAEDFERRLQSLAGSRFIPVVQAISQKVAKELVRKNQDKNVLITSPELIGQRSFSSQLVVDDDCAEMSDAIETEYLNGALLIEAARQMFLACTLGYNVAPEFAQKMDDLAFTLSEVKVRYDNFVFPVDTTVKLCFDSIAIKGSTATGRATVKFQQFNKLCCEVSFSANAYPTKFLQSLEKRCAHKVKNRLHGEDILARL